MLKLPSGKITLKEVTMVYVVRKKKESKAILQNLE